MVTLSIGAIIVGRYIHLFEGVQLRVKIQRLSIAMWGLSIFLAISVYSYITRVVGIDVGGVFGSLQVIFYFIGQCCLGGLAFLMHLA